MKKIITLLVTVIFSTLTLFPTSIMASDFSNNPASSIIQPRTDWYYFWDVESKSKQGTTYGSWRLGPQGAGPGTISVNKEDTVTNTITGAYTSVSAISSYIGASINKSQSYSVNYSLPVPKGKTYQIKYRPLYTKYKIVQRRYYQIDGHSSPTSETKTCYVSIFYDWGFSYNVIK